MKAVLSKPLPPPPKVEEKKEEKKEEKMDVEDPAKPAPSAGPAGEKMDVEWFVYKLSDVIIFAY